jgi:hypothetical protein
MTTRNQSLRLCEILEEEYRHLHGLAASSAVTTTDNAIPVSLLNTEELIERLDRCGKPAGHTPGADYASYQPMAHKKQTRVLSAAELRYVKLNEWLEAEPVTEFDGLEAFPNKEAQMKARIETVLAKKLKEDLIETQSWMQDASLRPYTKGLLQCYKEQQTWSSRMSSKVKRSLKPTNDPQAVDEELLKRLLLEDAFVGYIKRMDDSRLETIFSHMAASQQSALCLSGGGIRSATFALGIVQGLTRYKVLREFTYLSTVSGGGYLGGWLTAWIHHAGFDQVEETLGGQPGPPLEPEAAPIRHLRRYSNYLSPVLGLFSADTWTLFAIYLRNMLLLWLVLIPLLAALTAVPWLMIPLAEHRLDSSTVIGIPVFVCLSFVFTVFGMGFVHAYRPRAKGNFGDEQGSQSSRDQSAFLQKCLLPLSLAVFCWMLAWRWFEHLPTDAPAYLLNLHRSLGLNVASGMDIVSTGGGFIMVGSAAAHFLGWVLSLLITVQRPPKPWWVEPLAVLVTGAFAGFLLLLTAQSLRASNSDDSIIAYTCLGVPGFLLAVVMAGFAFEGLMSLRTNDAQREWSARHSAWLLIVAMGWLVMMGLILKGPWLVEQAIDWLGLPTTAGLGAGSALLTALLGQSSKTAGEGEGAGARKSGASTNLLRNLLPNLTLPVVAVIALIALIITLSLFDLVLIRGLCASLQLTYPANRLLDVSDFYLVNPGVPVLVIASLTLIGLVVGLAVDTNKFSLHALYRARLIRAYLAASRPSGERVPNPFTGFDETDNIYMGAIRPTNPAPPASDKKTPFHVINMALNLVSGSNLAWQERKAESFTVSALHAGSLYLGYRRTHLPGNPGFPLPNEDPRYYGGKRGITLGTAMTISGAAASPNQGYHSSPVIGFLMTLFNVRLGWWLGNPGPAGHQTFHKASPTLAIKPILDELTGNTDDLNPYVYLSDGGHFENLGLYEMVLRRNRFIVVSDAGCDESCTLEDLGNAIRKIRIDLGIPIDFPPQGFQIRSRLDALKTPSMYWAIGRIRYSKVDDPQSGSTDRDGILLYIKPGIIGDEPQDIFNYAAAKKAFPHETTADQFFSESQFESYRALGSHVLERVQFELKKEYGLSIADLLGQTATDWKTCLNALDHGRLTLPKNGVALMPN